MIVVGATIAIIAIALITVTLSPAGSVIPDVQPKTFAAAKASETRTLIVLAGRPDRLVEGIWSDERVSKRLSDGFEAMYFVPGQFDSNQPEVSDLLSQPDGVLAFRSGKLVDRAPPFGTPEDLLRWLDEVEDGVVSIEYIRELGSSDTQYVRSLYCAERLYRAGLKAEADVRYARLYERWMEWKNEGGELEQARVLTAMERFPEVRVRGRPALMARENGSARAAEIRDIIAARVEASDDVPSMVLKHDVFRWIEMNGLVPDVERLDRWFNKRKSLSASDEEAVRQWRKLAIRNFVRDGQWASAGRLIERPLDLVAQHYAPIAFMKMTNDAPPRGGWKMEDIDRGNARFLEESSIVYAAMLAAGREVDAELVGSAVLHLADTPEARTALVARALEAGVVREVHREWAQQAAADNKDDLQRRVAEALAKSVK